MPKLVTNVHIGGNWYGPDYGDPPGNVAKDITNPAAWDTAPADPDDSGSDDLELDALRARAEEAGVKVDKRWGTDKLRSEIQRAQAKG